MSEGFQPPPHIRPDSVVNRILYAARLTLDFQFLTVYRHLKPFLGSSSGTVIDIGAGESPFMHLLNTAATQYIGLDTHDAKEFGYENDRVLRFDGRHLPFDDESVDHFICTEVLEHVEEPHIMVDEMYRVTKPGGSGAITIPWSARFHFIPYDYHRLTPTSLRKLFSRFASAEIAPRGSDIVVIASKTIVAYARLFTPRKKAALVILLPLALVFLPVAVVAAAVGHVALWLRLGSADDPLGYTVLVRK